MLQASKFSEEKWPLAFELLNNCGGENHEGFIGVQDLSLIHISEGYEWRS